MSDTSGGDQSQTDEWTVESNPLGRDHWKHFPCAPGSKKPALEGDWRGHATSDGAQLGAWRAAGLNLALDCEASGVTVIDLDGGDIGEATWARVQAEHGAAPATYTVRTPSGGRHVYFEGRAPSSAQKLGPKVDTRGVGGYVVTPPSVVAGDTYYVETDLPLAPLPAWIAPLLQAGSERAAAAVDIQLDLPANVRRATDYLARLAPAIEGEGGDDRTYRTACSIRDLGLSADMAFEVMQPWNDRCEPPWDYDELREVIGHAYAYAQNAEGAWAATDPAGRFRVALQALAPATGLPSARPVPFSELLARDVPPVAELIPGLLEKGVVTFLAGPGGVHKSRLALQWGLCLDAGASIFGRTTTRSRFVYLSCEDHADEVARRTQAITARLKLPTDSAGQFLDMTAEDATLAVVRDSGECVPTEGFARLHAWLRSMAGHKFVVLDSTYNVLRFEGSAKINEGGVKAAIALLQRICDEADATLLVLWHPSQSGQDRGDASGWSVAWHNAPRARLSISAVKEDGDAFTLKVEKRNHGAKGAPITLHWSLGALLPRADLDVALQAQTFRSACILAAVEAAQTSQAIQRQRRPPGWVFDDIERACGRKPTLRELQEELARALRDQDLRYLSGSKDRVAGYYPFDEDRAAALARDAKMKLAEAKAKRGQD
jgi:Bifunctional DNA primase/polymerase, N-terminal/AAA domain